MITLLAANNCSGNVYFSYKNQARYLICHGFVRNSITEYNKVIGIEQINTW